MSIKIEEITENNFDDIPEPCSYCLYWQTIVPFNGRMLKPEKKKEKQEWFNKVIEEFGNCGFIIYFSGVPIGFIQYGLTKFFPRIKDYESGPPSEDAVFLACFYIANREVRGKGLGTIALKKLLNELKARGFRAIETFARRSSMNNPSGPLELYLKQGFKVKRDKSDFPLIRLELKRQY
ncbi:GNAT family N-acetyltransferase [Candidatus Bathyarchaeota archaeon]|nr:GNAT family N-acetyltransferase [Candidatus Bathyarchaeota archaeon]